MRATETMRWMGRSARSRASAIGHSMKDRVLEKRLERMSDETDRLRLENEMLRGEVAETRTEHERIIDLLETRLSDDTEGKKRHRGRWVLMLAALGGGVYALIRSRSSRNGQDEWGERPTVPPKVSETSASTI